MPRILFASMRAWGIAVVFVLAGCSSSTTGSHTSGTSSQVAASTLTVTGSLALRGRIDFIGTGSGDILIDAQGDCQGEAGFNDITAGAQVVVSDATGKTVALGSLAGGMYDKNATGIDIPCTFPFTVTGVPSGQSFYGVEIEHRGKQQYTAAQLASPVTLTLGTAN